MKHHSATKFFLSFILYFIASKLSLYLQIDHNVPLLWTATGVGVGILAFFGINLWPSLFFGSFFAYFSSGERFLPTIPLALSYTAESVLAFWIIRKIYYKDGSAVPQKKPAAFLLASLLPPILSSSVVYLLKHHSVVSEMSSLTHLWSMSWLGDVIGILSLSPILYHLRDKSPSSPKIFETWILYALTTILSFVLFNYTHSPSYLLLIFPFLLLISNHLGGKEVKIASLIVFLVAMTSTLNSRGPFLLASENNQINLQLFLLSLQVTALVLSSLKVLEKRMVSNLTLLLCWALTGFVSQSFQNNEIKNAEHDFKLATEKATSAINEAFHTYEISLWSAVAFINASEKVTHSSWKNFIESYGPIKKLPGLTGLGIAYPVKPSEVTARIKKEQALGQKKFIFRTIPGHKANLAQDHFLVTLVEPFRNFEALGLDLGSDSHLRAAAEQARDLGVGVSSKKVTLVQSENGEEGFLYFVPFYENRKIPNTVSERRSQFKGLVYGPIVFEEFFRSSIKAVEEPFNLVVFDSKDEAKESIVYKSSQERNVQAFITTDMTLGNLALRLRWYPKNLWRELSVIPSWILLIGCLFSLLFASLVVGYQNIYRQAEDIAEEKTKLLLESEQTIKSINADLERKVKDRTTDLTSALEILRDSEASFRELADTMPQIVWWSDEKGLAQYYNQRWYDYTGFPKGSIDPQKSYELIHPDDRDLILNKFKESMNQHTPFEAQLRLWNQQRKEYRWQLTRTEPVKDDEGNVKRWYGTTTDIHDQMSLLNREHAAHESSRLKSEFLANMSHEVRTPLNIIIGLTNLLEDTSLSQEQKEYVTNLKRSGLSLRNLVTDILDFSKIEAGKTEIENTPLSLKNMLNEIILEHANEAIIKDLGFELSLVSKIPDYIYGDETKLRQILSNLISNALKFTKVGIIKVEVSCDQHLLTFKVMDQGIGMDQAAINKLFKPFSQADASTSRLFGGTGLGLSICKNYIELMNGQISVTSSPGKGSVFSFTLPYTEASEDTAFQKNTETTKDLIGIRILLAEDNDVNAKITKKMLENRRAHVQIAKDGMEVLEALRTEEFDLILMDCQMPVLDGYKTTELIRNSDEFETIRNIPIIALTANALKEDRKRCIEIGMDGYLSKPVAPEEMSQAIRRRVFGLDVIDEASLERLRKFDADGSLLREVIESFVFHSRSSTAKMRTNLQAQDYGELKRGAHSLKSSALNVGAKQLSYLAKAIEMMSDAEIGNSEEMIVRIEAEMERVIEALRTVFF